MKREIEAILETMLPGGYGFPGGAVTGAVDWLETQDRFRPALEALIAELPSSFVEDSPEARTNSLEAAERRIPAVFDVATVAVYSAYYTRAEVLAAIEAIRGYKAGPPQPGGYDLPAFDPGILAVPRARTALWRDPTREAPK